MTQYSCEVWRKHLPSPGRLREIANSLARKCLRAAETDGHARFKALDVPHGVDVIPVRLLGTYAPFRAIYQYQIYSPFLNRTDGFAIRVDLLAVTGEDTI